jgi:hypothetical protein
MAATRSAECWRMASLVPLHRNRLASDLVAGMPPRPIGVAPGRRYWRPSLSTAASARAGTEEDVGPARVGTWKAAPSVIPASGDEASVVPVQ